MIAADIVAAFPPGERTLPSMLERQAQRYGGRRLFDRRRDELELCATRG